MHGEEQDVLFGREAQQLGAQQRTVFEIEGLLCFGLGAAL
ncbi:hypothetical protein AWB78_08611 [Caballeronia calidae]|uniref:Uncharacterized protein n=1 Tax=Caballeronia calidae TaxID=1777139 RepID=A0A158EL39_9BURK|nr:hypothetical protein AWB78_08611 [Caballeronia calidae]